MTLFGGNPTCVLHI